MSAQETLSQKSVKFLREDEPRINKQRITSEMARAGLPEGCVVIPMKILDEPTPIRKRKR